MPGLSGRRGGGNVAATIRSRPILPWGRSGFRQRKPAPVDAGASTREYRPQEPAMVRPTPSRGNPAPHRRPAASLRGRPEAVGSARAAASGPARRPAGEATDSPASASRMHAHRAARPPLVEAAERAAATSSWPGRGKSAGGGRRRRHCHSRARPTCDWTRAAPLSDRRQEDPPVPYFRGAVVADAGCATTRPSIRSRASRHRRLADPM